MDIATTTATSTANIKTPEAESETPTRIHPAKPLSFTNGVLKRHHPLHHHHNYNNHGHPLVVTYKECLKNHAASLGGHAVDGCGEFMPSPTSTPTDPTSLKCAACGCHRNFHRREPEEHLPAANTTPALEYQSHHRHHPPPPPPPHRGSSPSSPSPPPISSSYYPSAPHMLLALSSGLSGPMADANPPVAATPNTAVANPNGRKRFRTKFTQDQKERMLEFAERVGWKMQKRDEESINEFCSEVGVDRGVLKVWMHNNKNTFSKRDQQLSINITPNSDNVRGDGNGNGNGVVGSYGIVSRNSTALDEGNNENEEHTPTHTTHLHNSDSVSAHVVAANGSSSSS